MIFFDHFIDRNLIWILFFLFKIHILCIMLLTELMIFWKTDKSRSLWVAWYVNLHKIWNTVLTVYSNIVRCLIFLGHINRIILTWLAFRLGLFIDCFLRKVRIRVIPLINDIKLTILHTTINSITIISIDINIVKIINLRRM